MTAKVTGPAETKKRLARWHDRELYNAVRKAARRMAATFRDALKANAPIAKADYGPGGTTKKSIGSKVKVYSTAGKKAGTAWVGAGPKANWSRTVKKKFQIYRRKGKKFRKFKPALPEKVAPARVVGLIEKKTGFIKRTSKEAGPKAMNEARQILAQAAAKV